MKELSPGATTLAKGSAPKSGKAEMRETQSSYMTLRVTDTGRDMEIYKKLHYMPGVAQCDAVRGDVDIILLLHADSQAEMDKLQAKVRAVEGVEVVSLSAVKRPALDKDIHHFIEVYRKTVKEAVQAKVPHLSGMKSYVIVDIDKAALQQVFTTLFFLDEVLFCDLIDDGTRLIGIISEQGAFGKTPRIIDKLGQIDGVLRVKEASIIKLLEEN